jgi:hypothetical protein
MNHSDDEPPADTPATPRKGAQQEAERHARAERVAAALRANLGKRKQQARARAAEDEEA